MMKRTTPQLDLVTLAYSLAIAQGKVEAASSSTMDPISEDEKPTASTVTFAAIKGDDLDESQRSKELAIQKLLNIADDNKIIIDDHLRRAILGKEEDTYTSSDAVESIRRSSSSSITKRRSSSSSDISSLRRRSSLITRSRRHLGSLFRKNSSREVLSDKETVDSDSHSSLSSCVHTSPSQTSEDSGRVEVRRL
jgi:hypothetical protein